MAPWISAVDLELSTTIATSSGLPQPVGSGVGVGQVGTERGAVAVALARARESQAKWPAMSLNSIESTREARGVLQIARRAQSRGHQT